MNEFKTLYNTYKAAAEETNNIEAAWEANPENEELEAAFDEAYNKEFAAHNELVAHIIKITDGQIDNNTARMLIATRAKELEEIIERIA